MSLASLGTLTQSLYSACIVVYAVTVTPAENFVSPLSESSGLLLRVSIKKKKKKRSVSPHDSQFIQKRTFANPSKFLWTLRSTDWKWTAVALRSTDWKRTAVDRRRGITAAEGHGASKSTGWPRQRWTKSPRLRQLAELKETNKKNPELVSARLGAFLDVVGTFWIWSSRQQTCFDHCWARHAPLTLFDCVTCAIYVLTLTVRDKPAAWLHGCYA